ncbi:hypothetical protein CQW23_34910 [Capsicum baccatum]|uniref:Uncharacterized protein n=1 Tax=Capsicum baccatum TaxID=33114 RepID=A0A2G2UXK8_CAPBA|nr:hypothetical protein CQW23_34910 [Capsicum baccatum]
MTSILASDCPCVFTDVKKRSGAVKVSLTVRDDSGGGDSGRGTRNDVALSSLSPLLVHRREESIEVGKSITGNQKMVSAGGTFALGFFTLRNSTYI